MPFTTSFLGVPW
jgi:hypothetical protein